MRTKTILTMAALSVASIATAVAQTVYSVNAVGYVNVTVPAGKFALLANPLNQPTNSLSAVLPGVPNGTIVFIANSAGGFDKATLRGTVWTGPGATDLLNPGAGFFVQNAGTADMTITFVGEVPQGTNLVVSVPVGFSLLSSIVPQQGKIETDLKFPAVNTDKLFIFDTTSQAYQAFTRRGAATWTGVAGVPEPVIAVAQGFFYQAAAATTWTRSFTVNQ
jgi:hypothetical protein